MEGLGCGVDCIAIFKQILFSVRKKIVIWIVVVFLAGLLLAMVLPALTPASNCGGNSYALTTCKLFLLTARTHTGENHLQFEVTQLGQTERSDLAKLAQSHWVSGADFLMKTNFNCKDAKRDLVVICEKPFGNVPQPAIWNFYRRNPAHAVGYSDGSVGLISLAEFKALDLAGFIHLSSLGTNISGQSVQP